MATKAVATDGKPVVRVEFDIVGISSLSFGKPVTSIKETGETHEAFEQRTWKERIHADASGQVYIPPIMMKKCMESVAQHLSETVPGKGKATFTKHFLRGIMITDPILIGVHIDDVKPIRLYVNADGKKGSGTRVWRIFCDIPEWGGHVVIHVLDPMLQGHSDRIEIYAEHAGTFIGLGRYAPRNGGHNGRFTVKNFERFYV